MPTKIELQELKDRVQVVLNEQHEVVTDEPVIGAINMNAQVLMEVIDALENLQSSKKKKSSIIVPDSEVRINE